MNYRWLKDANSWSYGHTFLNDVMIGAAKYLIYLVFALLALLLLWRLRRREWRPVGAVVVTLVVGFLLGLLAAALHPEQRPFITHPNLHLLVAHAGGQSFPSDHATAAFTVAAAVAAFLSWRWGALFTALAVVIGFARVFDALHYPGDIAGGLLVGVVAAGLVALALRFVPAGGRRRSLPVR